MTTGSDDNSRLLREIKSLQEHVTALENRVAALEAGRTSSVPAPSEDQRIESRLGLLWVNRIGAITLAFGVLFLFKYAIDKQWITIWGRILLGLLSGVILTGFSEWLLRRDQRVFSQGVYGCGIAVFCISLYFGVDQIWSQYGSAVFAIGVVSAIFAVLLFFALRWRRNLFIVFNTGWAMISAGLVLHRHDPFVFASFVFSLALVHFAASSRMDSRAQLWKTNYVLGHVCLVTAVIQSLLTWIHRNVAGPDTLNVTSESLSVLFALYAIGMITMGFARRQTLDRLLGLLAIGFIVLKLYLYDVWLLDRLYRISAFVALGILLLAASYLYSRWKDKLDVLWTAGTD